MTFSPTIKTNFIYIVALLFIVLFTYAAVSKILDFENFQVQLGQSPLLSAFAISISYLVPSVELILVFMLTKPRFRLIGLYGSFVLMTMFTSYIYIILNYSSFIPCSCGGILEKMSWNEHLLFNIAFVILSTLAIILYSATKIIYGSIILLFTSAIAFIVILFLMSEDIMQHKNTFVRRLPQQFFKDKLINLGYNSYYLAGATDSKIYLGNVTAPLHITETDLLLTSIKKSYINLSNVDYPFRSLNIQTCGNYFYVSDGTVPVIFRGKTDNWNAAPMKGLHTPFSNPVFTDSGTAAFRTHKKNLESILATSIISSGKIKTNPQLLQKQIDGRFDTDGILNYDPSTNNLIYIYYYRNQYTVSDAQLNLQHRGNTIDTTTRAKIKVAHIKSRNEKKFAAPPLTVNLNSFAYNGLLFVQSALMGQFESDKMWKQASMIDIYDYTSRSYIASFYVYNIDGGKLTDFLVQGNKFYGIVGSHLVSYKLSHLVVDRYHDKKQLNIKTR
jgi:hypothetical protein